MIIDIPFYLELSKIDYIHRGELAKKFNRAKVSDLTICPECKCNNYYHMPGCSLGKVSRSRLSKEKIISLKEHRELLRTMA